MRYVTIAMIAAHAGRGIETVRVALKRAGVKVESFPGVKGLRIAEKDANRFLLRQWPAAGPLPVNPVQ